VKPAGTDVEIRTITTADADAVRTFFADIPERDRTFFREDVLAPDVVERWARDRYQQRSVALIDGAIAGHVAVIRGVGWSRHVGEIRLVVAPEHRRRGLGRLLAQRAVVDAVGQGMTKLVVEVVAEQEATVAMFSSLGFEAEGLLKDHVRAASGETHDLLVLAHFVEQLWATMTTTGVDEALGIGD
jgi:L-amino acid N-acyltransferase YncA